MSRFDERAKTWDTGPRLKLAEAVTASIKKNVDFSSSQSAADFGAGTGLITLAIAPLVKNITAVDSSKEMLEVLKEKAESFGLKNVDTLFGDTDSKEIRSMKFDVIVSSMTLHHIKSTEEAAALFYEILNNSGTVAIADLDEEKGDFHPNNDDVHHFGFDRDELKKAFLKAGFSSINFDTAYVMKKPSSTGEIKDYSIFLLVACK